MALIDTAVETVRETLGDVAEMASAGRESVASALSDVADEERSRKGLAVLVLLLLLAVVGVVAWRVTSAKGAEPSGEDKG